MILKKIDLQSNTSIHIGPIVEYVEVKKIEDLLEISQYAKANNKKIHVLGEGTNSYFAERLNNYLFIKLDFDKEISFTETKNEKVIVESNATVNWNDLVMATVEKNLWGLENLTYIPGSVGAAPVQNIGAYGVELKKNLQSIKVFDLKKNMFVTLRNHDCNFSYRNSIFKKQKNRYIILSVRFVLSRKRKPILTYSPLNKLDKEKVTVKDISDCVKKIRQEKLPDYNIFPNAGSFFKNPKVSDTILKKLLKRYPNIVYFKEDKKNKIALGWIIENIIKMKGVMVGNFSTYKNHALVLVNHNGKGDAKELNKFVKLLARKIKQKTGLVLEQEVNYIG